MLTACWQARPCLTRGGGVVIQSGCILPGYRREHQTASLGLDERVAVMPLNCWDKTVSIGRRSLVKGMPPQPGWPPGPGLLGIVPS